jgi:cardiolipin synthase
MHAKVAVVDGRWATVGSSNLDPLSLLLAREANVVVHDEAFAQGLQQSLEQAIRLDAKRVEARQHAKRNMRQRVFDALAYRLMRMLLFVAGRRY